MLLLKHHLAPGLSQRHLKTCLSVSKCWVGKRNPGAYPGMGHTLGILNLHYNAQASNLKKGKSTTNSMSVIFFLVWSRCCWFSNRFMLYIQYPCILFLFWQSLFSLILTSLLHCVLQDDVSKFTVNALIMNTSDMKAWVCTDSPFLGWPDWTPETGARSHFLSEG